MVSELPLQASLLSNEDSVWNRTSLCTKLWGGDSLISNHGKKTTKWIIPAKFEDITDSYLYKGNTKYRCTPTELLHQKGMKERKRKRETEIETEKETDLKDQKASVEHLVFTVTNFPYWVLSSFSNISQAAYCGLFWGTIFTKYLNLMFADRLWSLEF